MFANALRLILLFIVTMLPDIQYVLADPLAIDQLPRPRTNTMNGYLNSTAFRDPQFHQYIQQWATECGTNTFYIKPSIISDGLVTLDPHIIDEVLGLRMDTFRRFNKIETTFINANINGTFSQEGESWKLHRECFVAGLKDTNDSQIEKTADNLVSAINKSIDEDDDTLPITPLFTRYTSDIISLITFNHNLGSLRYVYEEHFAPQTAKILPLVHEQASSIFGPTVSHWFSNLDFNYNLDKRVNDFKRYFKPIIKLLKHQYQPPNPFLKACKDNGLTEEEIMANTLNFFVTGQNKAACAMAWALKYILTSNRLVQLQALDPAQLPEQLDTMILASMKQNPVMPILFHETLLDHTTAPNPDNLQVVIPKNTLVITFTGNGKTNETSQFNKHRNFGGGPRVCPGMTLAMNEIHIGLKKLILHFDMNIENPGIQKGVFKFIVIPEGLTVKFKKRPAGIQHKSHHNLAGYSQTSRQNLRSS